MKHKLEDFGEVVAKHKDGTPLMVYRDAQVEHKKELCTICECELDEDAGDVKGYFGILPMGFCVWCMSSLTDMVIQMNGFNDIETLKERINDLEEDALYENELDKRRADKESE